MGIGAIALPTPLAICLYDEAIGVCDTLCRYKKILCNEKTLYPMFYDVGGGGIHGTNHIAYL